MKKRPVIKKKLKPVVISEEDQFKIKEITDFVTKFYDALKEKCESYVFELDTRYCAECPLYDLLGFHCKDDENIICPVAELDSYLYCLSFYEFLEVFQKELLQKMKVNPVRSEK